MLKIKPTSPPNPLNEMWRTLAVADTKEIANCSGAVQKGRNWQVSAIGQNFIIDGRDRLIIHEATRKPAPFLLQLVILHYLLKAQPLPLSGRLVSSQEFVGGEFFFRGPHAFKLEPLEEKFGRDKDGFLEAGRLLGGHLQDLAETSFTLLALPRIPLTYLLWCADEEFPAKIKVLFDASAEQQLPLDMLWTLVNLVNRQLSEY